MFEKYQGLLDKAQAAIEAGNAEEAKKFNNEAAALKALIDEQERTAKLKADVEAKAAASKKAAEEQRQVEIDAAAEVKAKEMLRKVGVQRPFYADDDDDPISPEHSIRMRGPYDDVDAFQLALGYMVMKSAVAIGKRPPSRDYFRAVHGRAQDYVIKGGLQPIGLHDEDAPATKFLRGRGLAPQPTFYHIKADNVVRQALAVKADELMGSDVSSAGDEWIPVFYSRELFRLVRNEARVASLFRQVEVAGESLVFPIQSGGVTWYKTPQTDDAAEMVYSNTFITSRISQAATGSMTLTPAKISAIVIWTGELNEQSLVPMLPFLQSELVTSGQHTVDELIISGDETTGATNISDYGNGSISAYWRLLALDGLRSHAIVDNSTNSRDAGDLTAEDFLDTQKLMGTDGKLATNPNLVAWIMDNALYYQMLSLGEVLTRDKFGTAATIVDGRLDRIFGSAVVPSDDYGKTDASGYIHNTTSGNTLGSFMCVRPDQGVVGFGRRMMVETNRIARADAYEIVGHISLDFDLADVEAVALSYNVTV